MSLIYPKSPLPCKVPLCKFKIGTPFSKWKETFKLVFSHTTLVTYMFRWCLSCYLLKEHSCQHLCANEDMFCVLFWVCVLIHVPGWAFLHYPRTRPKSPESPDTAFYRCPHTLLWVKICVHVTDGLIDTAPLITAQLEQMHALRQNPFSSASHPPNLKPIR